MPEETRFQYRYYLPTEIVSGRGCISEHASALKKYGGRALIATGKSSAKNGSLADVTAALEANGQAFFIFDEVTPNPDVECVQRGAAKAKDFKADFIIGVGGGSPLDAAKAIAALARQPRTGKEIFGGNWTEDILPVVAVPTTAGTGSEVTPYAVLTDHFKQTKTSIFSPAMFPRLAFLDGSYMRTLGRDSTIRTAVDALSHAVEGMFTTRSTPVGDLAALESIRLLFGIFPKFVQEPFSLSLSDRDALLYASMLAGTVIAQSGTTAVHALGYPLTYHHGTDHGEANGVLLGEMLALCGERLPSTTKRILGAANLTGVDAFKEILKTLLKEHTRYALTDLKAYAREAAANPKLKSAAYRPNEEDLLRIYLKSDIVKWGEI